jgi:trimethylamine--corrinoid protein Co-methyltransferase
MPGLGRAGLKGNLISPLVPGEIEMIHEGALRLLGEAGLLVHDAGVLALCERIGCPVDRAERRVYLPGELVTKAIDSAPLQVTLYTREGEKAMVLGSGSFYARTSSGAIRFLDLDTGKAREPTSRDAADAVRLADALPRIHGVSTMAVQPADVPVTTVDIHAFRLALTHTAKPLGYVCLNEPLIEPVLAMAALVAGGEDALQARPFVTALAESTSPLRLVGSQLAVLQAFASRGLPLTLHAHPVAGFTAPVTLAGELVVTHAEVLALVTIAQMVRPGAPVIYGMSSSVPDMRNGRNLSGAVEIGLLGAAVAGLAKACGLPCLVSTGTDAHAPGNQSVMERLMTLLPPALAGVDLVNLTTLETKMVFSLEQLVIDDMLLQLVGRMLCGIEVEPERLALDLLIEMGPGGGLVESAHTRRFLREELLVPGLISHEARDEWEAAGGPDVVDKARDKARQILEEHRPEPIPEAVSAGLDDIVERSGHQVRE